MATVKFRIRRDTAANWNAANPILALGEPGLETDTRRVKYGDGTTPWTALPYSRGGAKPAVIVYRQVSSGSFQTIGKAFTVLQVNSVALDTAAGFSPSTFFYTAPEAGSYLVTGRYRVVDPAPAGINCAIGIDVANADGPGVFWQTVPAITSGVSRHSMQITRILTVTAGQQIRLFGYIDSTTAAGIQSAELSASML